MTHTFDSNVSLHSCWPMVWQRAPWKIGKSSKLPGKIRSKSVLPGKIGRAPSIFCKSAGSEQYFKNMGALNKLLISYQ